MSNATMPDNSFWQNLGWEPTADQKNQLLELQNSLRQWNSKVNLTRLVEDNDFWINQIFDSLWPLQNELSSADQPRRCIDVGTGGGFPGLAAAIALPGSRFTLVDSVGRKTTAVQAMAAELGLSDRITVRTERIEETGQQKQCRGCYDLAMARAVATAPVVAEYLAPLLKQKGDALLYRGHWDDQQQLDLARAAKILKTEIKSIQKIELPDGRGVRHVIRLSPTAPCPRTYPRAVGIPSKVPLP
ncbi:MAG: 16S rRNA (guanine(527)-N(7))-methyltransferase RsmG [Synechococcus sp.]